MPAPPTIDILAEEHNFTLDIAGRLTFDKEHPWHRNLIALLGTMIELAGAMVVSERKNTGIAIRGLFRTYLETFVEITNLHQDRMYGENMDIAYLIEWNKSLKSARDGNPFLASIGQLPDINEKIRENEVRIDDLKKKGVTKLTVFERFQKAGMENEYRSIYNQLSSDSHSNIRALVDRHFELNDAGNDFEVVIYKDYRGEFDHIYSDCAKLLLLGAQRVAIALESALQNEIEEKLKSHEE